jgi:antitoxin (DNA-binding transcriptional repressor) of toxin-antitoxin stability system
MEPTHVSATEAPRDFAGPLSRVQAGAEVVIDDGSLTVVGP